MRFDRGPLVERLSPARKLRYKAALIKRFKKLGVWLDNPNAISLGAANTLNVHSHLATPEDKKRYRHWWKTILLPNLIEFVWHLQYAEMNPSGKISEHLKINGVGTHQ
jgi:hypothetical protein